MEDFLISPVDCRILIAIEESKSLRAAARILRCDPTGLQRKVQMIASEHGLLQKVNGRWRPTDLGKRVLGWTRYSIIGQRSLLEESSSLRIAATSWFAERVLIPNLSDLLPKLRDWNRVHIEIPEGDFESTLLEGKAEYVIVCHPPANPAIYHRQISAEPWSIVVSSELVSKGEIRRLKLSDLENMPSVRHREINPQSMLPDLAKCKDPAFTSNSLVAIRSALCAGMGWSIVPSLLVKEEIESGTLVELNFPMQMDRKVCLWWLRSSSQSSKQAATISRWLSENS